MSLIETEFKITRNYYATKVQNITVVYDDKKETLEQAEQRAYDLLGDWQDADDETWEYGDINDAQEMYSAEISDDWEEHHQHEFAEGYCTICDMTDPDEDDEL
jgi:hypothetical protein